MALIVVLASILGLARVTLGCAGTGAAAGAGAVGGAVGHVGEVAGHAGHVGLAVNPAGMINHGVAAIGHAQIPLVIPVGRCLYDEAQVRMADGTLRQVNTLVPGDEVLAYSADRGIHKSPILGQLYTDNTTRVTILEIETSSGRKIPVTLEHSLFVRECVSEARDWSPKAARDVRVGDCLPRYYADDGDVIEESVRNIRLFEARGIRQPVTETGTLIVDDVVISCYDRVVNQRATHMALLPYRFVLGLAHKYTAHCKSLIPSLLNLIGFDASLF